MHGTISPLPPVLTTSLKFSYVLFCTEPSLVQDSQKLTYYIYRMNINNLTLLNIYFKKRKIRTVMEFVGHSGHHLLQF